MSAIEPREGREWWPFAYLDASMPPGRDTPDAWLCRLDDGAHAYGIPGERWHGPEALTEGQTIEFMWGDDLGEATLTVAVDGTFTCAPAPVGWDYVHVVGDPEMGGGSMEALVEALKEFGEHEGQHAVQFARSSNGISFRFTAKGGPPRFEPVEVEQVGGAA